MEFIDMLRRRVEELRAEQTALLAQLDELLAAPAEEQRDLTADEDTQFAELRSRLDRVTSDVDDAEQRLAELTAIETRRAEAAAAAPVVAVRSEPSPYLPGGDHSFVADVYAATFRAGDVTGAEQRLAAHRAATEQRDVGVAAFGGLVPPQYIVDAYAPAARGGRPFLDAIKSQPLPSAGTSFVIPRITTGTAAAQTAEGAAFNEQDVAVTNLTVDVQLTTAAQDVSRTVVERGGAVVDQILLPDLLAALEVTLDAQAINGSGTAPQHRGVLNVTGVNTITWTDTTPTVAELIPKLADAIQRISSTRFAPADLIVMHPRRWGWITAAVDAASRPLVVPAAQQPVNALGVGQPASSPGPVGQLLGLPVVVDANIPTNLGAGTNEDTIIVCRTSDILVWEAPTMQFVMEQAIATAPGQIRVAVGRFALIAAGRYPGGISVITGTGLTPPTF